MPPPKPGAQYAYKPLPNQTMSPSKTRAVKEPIPWVDLMNIIKAFIGSNYIAMPYAFRQGGVVAGSIGLCIIAWVTGYCCNLLVKCKRKVELSDPTVQTYGDVAFHVWGAPGRLLTDASLMLTQFGFCVGYMVFLSENIVALLPQVNAVESLAIVLPIFLYCCFLRSLRKLLPVSFLANIAILLGYFLVMDQAIKRLVEHGVDSTAMKPTVRTDTLPLFFGLVTSSYEGIGLILPVEGSIRKGREHFSFLLTIAIVIVSIILGSFGLMAFLAYGDSTCSIILLNLDGSAFIDIVKALVCVGVVFTYPMQIVPVIEILEQRLLGFYGHALEAGPGGNGHGPSAPPPTVEQNPLLGGGDDDSEHDEAVDGVIVSTGPPGGAVAPRRAAKSQGPPRRHSSFSVASPDSFDTRKRVKPTRASSCRPSSCSPKQWLETRRNILRPVCVLLTAGIALLVPNFGLFSSLVGSLGCAFLAFILPVLLHYQLFRTEGLSRKMMTTHMFILFFGATGAIVGVTVTIEDMINAPQSCS